MLCWRSSCVLFAFFVFGEATLVPASPARRPPFACTTPTNHQGWCLPIEQCKGIASHPSQYNGVTNRDRNHFQQWGCGRQSRYPKVCCPNKRPVVFGNHAPARPWTRNPSRPTNQVRPGNGQLPRQVNQGRPGMGANSGNAAEPKNAALLAEDLCGTVLNNRVLGGETVSLGEFPWMALVQYAKGGKLFYRCGGVLISKRYVLTAAHCVHPANINKHTLVAVRLGEHNTRDGTEAQDCVEGVCSEPVVDVPIEEGIIHPGYKSSDKNNNNDIALIRLATEVAFTQFIRPICLPHQQNLRTKDYDSQELLITGWGRTEDATGEVIFSASDVLKKASLPVVDSTRCTQFWAPGQTVRADMQICAGGVKGRDACKGDSGGPLMSAEKVARDRTVRFHVIGIVSYGERCTLTDKGRPPFPGVFTRVTFFVDWVLDQLKP